jgi:hypothetical protein
MLRTVIGAVSVAAALSLAGELPAAAEPKGTDVSAARDTAKAANPGAGRVPALVQTGGAQAVDAARNPGGDKSWKSLVDPWWRLRPEGVDRDGGKSRR